MNAPPDMNSTHIWVDVRKRVGYDADKNRLDRIWNPGNSYTTKHTKVTHGPGRVVTFQMLVILATTFNYLYVPMSILILGLKMS